MVQYASMHDGELGKQVKERQIAGRLVAGVGRSAWNSNAHSSCLCPGPLYHVSSRDTSESYPPGSADLFYCTTVSLLQLEWSPRGTVCANPQWAEKPTASPICSSLAVKGDISWCHEQFRTPQRHPLSPLRWSAPPPPATIGEAAWRGS